jgi:D-alanine-D-alanine ligase-like ATP-grasp enzyme
MTNSGREDTMVQLDYLELRKRLRNAGCSFEEVWIKIESAVKSIMQIYQTLHNDSNRLALLGIPKVLGFDFIVTMDGDPMLLEVNRFPGLQPRSKDDEAVKHAVVRQAWLCAALRFVNHEGAEGPQTLCKQLL